jgi:hypothetical protein
MTCSVICRYLSEAKSSGLKKKLLVCGPTNKSVVVLTRKVIKCVEREDSLNVVLVGDKAELLSDNPELERIFVYGYVSHLAKTFVDACLQFKIKAYNEIDKTKKADFEIGEFKKTIDCLFVSMKRKTPSTSTQSLENALKKISGAFETGKKDSNRFDKALKEVKRRLGAVDVARVVEDLLDTADVVFCTLSSAGSTDVKKMRNVTD